MREYDKFKISELVPYELSVTSAQLRSARRHLKDDAKFDPPAKVFRIPGLPDLFLRNGTHHVYVAAERGDTEVPIQMIGAPGDSSDVADNIQEHRRYKGITNLPIGSREGRYDDARNPKIDIEDLKRRLKDLESDADQDDETNEADEE